MSYTYVNQFGQIEKERERSIQLANLKANGLKWFVSVGIELQHISFCPYSETFYLGWWRDSMGIEWDDYEKIGQLREKIKLCPFKFNLTQTNPLPR